MTVKDKSDKRVAQGALTRTALVGAARELFGTQGYVDTSNDEIVARAGLTKGALYHHFKGKEDLFRVVFEQVQHEVTDQAVAEFLLPDSWEALVRGCTLWIDAHLDPAVRRIVLHDPRAVLGWEVVREIENKFGTVALRGALRKAMVAGVIERRPLRPLSLLLLGALREGCLYIADAEDPTAARDEVIELFTDMLSTFRLS
jgi:AcrR family transcriptional regulator